MYTYTSSETPTYVLSVGYYNKLQKPHELPTHYWTNMILNTYSKAKVPMTTLVSLKVWWILNNVYFALVLSVHFSEWNACVYSICVLFFYNCDMSHPLCNLMPNTTMKHTSPSTLFLVLLCIHTVEGYILRFSTFLFHDSWKGNHDSWTKQKNKIKTIAGWYTPTPTNPLVGVGEQCPPGSPVRPRGTQDIDQHLDPIHQFLSAVPKSQRKKPLSKDDMTIMTMIHTYPF